MDTDTRSADPDGEVVAHDGDCEQANHGWEWCACGERSNRSLLHEGIGRDDPVTLFDMRSTGAKYRQLDYWHSCGWFSPPGPVTPPKAKGSGHSRRWTYRDYLICELMVRLRAAGVVLGRAGRIARDAVDLHVNRVTTEDGITIEWTRLAP